MRTTLLSLLAMPIMAFAQDYVQPAPAVLSSKTGTEVNLGIGLGLDYGGIGGHVELLPDPHFAGFAGLGYVLVGFGYNVGVVGRILPNSRVCPFVSAMYGYNGVIKVEGASKYDKIYYGPSFGLGLEFHKRSSKNFWRVEFLLPVRPNEFQDDLDALKRNLAIVFETEPPPFGISGGYHFGL
ncbi:MAG: hypothetical protein IPO90_16830 [Flavobacteriales bacterium]|nr:hypothetical protein [Flavobacteriales bacterium]